MDIPVFLKYIKILDFTTVLLKKSLFIFFYQKSELFKIRDNSFVGLVIKPFLRF